MEIKRYLENNVNESIMHPCILAKSNAVRNNSEP